MSLLSKYHPCRNFEMKYRKQQKLSERKVLRFTGFHPNVGKTFTVVTSSEWKVLKKTNTQLRKLSQFA